MKKIMLFLFVFLFAFFGLKASFLCESKKEIKMHEESFTQNLEDYHTGVKLLRTKIVKVQAGLKRHRLFGVKIYHTKRTLYSISYAVYIPDSVNISLPNLETFGGIDSVVVSANNPNYYAQDGVLYSKDKSYLLYCPPRKEGKLTIIPTARYCHFPDEVSLSYINVPASVVDMNFPVCPYVDKDIDVVVDKVNKIYTSKDRCVYNKEITSLLYCPKYLKKLVLPATVKYFKRGITHTVESNYLNSNIENILLGDSCRDLDVFYDNYLGQLETVTVSQGNPFFSSVDGVLYDKKVTTLLRCPRGKKDTLIIPPTVRKIVEPGFYETRSHAALYACDLITSVFVPDSFSNVERLLRYVGSEIIVSKGNPWYSSDNGILYNKNEDSLLYCPSTKTKNDIVVIPSSVKGIRKCALAGKRMLGICLNDSVKVSDVTNSIFDCWYLQTIEAPHNNPYFCYQDGVLYNKDKTQIVFYDRNYNFRKKSYFPSSLKTINKELVSNCGKYDRYIAHKIRYKTVISLYNTIVPSKTPTFYIPATVEELQDEALNPSYIKFSYPNSIKFIGKHIQGYFDTLRLNSVEIIKPEAFSLKKTLKFVDITSDSLKTIEFATFQGCDSLTSVSLPKSITKIRLEAFKDCKSLKTFTIAAHTPVPLTEDAKVFEGVTLSRCTLRVPKGTAPAYRTALVWKQFGKIVEIE
jgi:hypothetical protein